MRKTKKPKFMSPLLQMRFNYLKAAEPLQGDCLLFTTKTLGVPGTHLNNLRKMKG